MTRSPIVFIAALLIAMNPAAAQLPAAASGKAPAPLMAKMVAGASEDLIVVYDDTDVEQEVRTMQFELGLSSRHERIVQRKAMRYAERKQAVLAQFGSAEVTALKHYSHLPLNFLRVRGREALSRLLADARIVGVFEDHINHKLLAESLPLINQPQVAAAGNVGAGTAVAVVDTGVDYTRAAFGSCTAPGIPASCKVVYAQDFAPDDHQLDDDGHGTNLAGIVAGVAPGTRIIALDVFSGSPGSSNFGAMDSDILDAMNWVIANKGSYNTVAINLSLGDDQPNTSPVTSGVYRTAIDQARAAGILTIAAAGNSGYTNALSIPAAVSGAISVGAVYDSAMGPMSWGRPTSCRDLTTAADKVVCFSNSASFLTLLAPGAQILAAGISESGTSQAAPHVAGAVAVLRAAFPNETLDQTVARLTNGVPVTDSRNGITKPRLDLQKAMGLTAACTYALSESSKLFGASGGSGTIAITANAGCPWTAASASNSADWLTVTSGSSGSGNGAVGYSVAANPNAIARTGTIDIFGQSYTVIQSGSAASLVNILNNPGFEDGAVSWTTETLSRDPIISAYTKPISPTNTWYAWLCGYNNCQDTLYQDVTLPADAQSAYLQFNYSITTKETSSLTDHDIMSIRVYGPPGASTYTSWTLTNRNATSGWVASPQYDLSAFHGQTIRLEFAATADASNTTSFYLDDVTLMVSGATPDTQAPTLPVGLTATAVGSGAIDLAWSASADNVGIAGYRVYRSGTLLASLGNVLTYRDTGLSAGTPYSYTVSACDAAGNCSAQSSAVVATTPAAADTQSPTMPTGLAASAVGTSQIDLSWVAATDNVGVTSYKVYRDGALLASLGQTTSHSDVGLRDSTSYSYTVAACDAANNCSDQSAPATATTGTSISFVVGWNLAGNSTTGALQAADSFNDAGKVSTVWKWIAATGRWAFYTPREADGGAAYAASKGYEVLTVVNGGEGFWVNASAAFSTMLPIGEPLASASLATRLGSGWNLISVGDGSTPRAFDNSLSATPPSAGNVAAPALTSLWAWDNNQATWYFYAPALDNTNSLATYAGSKGYLDFGSRTLAPGTGFWVNKP